MREITEQWLSERKTAVRITSHTLVGIMKTEFPLKRGNCFSMVTEDGREYRIVNFGMENLQKLIEVGLVSLPVMIHPISEQCATMADERIPRNWYMDRFCSVCTPFKLLTETQKISSMLREASGEVTCRKHSTHYNNDLIKANEKKVKEALGIQDEEEKDLMLGWNVYETIGVVKMNGDILDKLNLEGGQSEKTDD